MSSLENALKIMSLLDRTRPVLRVGEVCREIGIPKSSVSRLMKTLGDYGILEREAGEGVGYVAGPRSLLLADLYSAQHSLKDQVEVALERLTEEFGFAGYVSVINGADIIILSVRHGSYPLRLVREIGQPMPAFTTSVGRALMSYLEDGEIIRRARVHMGDRYSDQEILARVEMVRKYGVAWGQSAIIPGIAALAAAVWDLRRGDGIGLSISYPTAAVDPALRMRMFERLREEAAAIGRRARDPIWEARSVADGPIPDFEAEELVE
ncbi:IclR family transcriptional regulator [Mesorhizobium australicum]|uniref:Transcriptional regulator, IclR family n=1 Tax=Mesorhizobium australicum TaxID=536018 RepID=A0A1X7NFP6_9HYPH|nr:IclR family transcriptional regulator [Mesorhizobium australicum]SMH36588.1 transcriptional regulator, IclR family [Mesorhizobium australicum]